MNISDFANPNSYEMPPRWPWGTDSAGNQPAWLQYVPAELRGLVASHLPTGLPTTPVEWRAPASLWRGRPDIVTEPVFPCAPSARFLDRTFAHLAGSRPYKLYVPSSYDGTSIGLVVMLHGCTQSPDDFAAGTRMNEAAERQGFLVVYPGQTVSAHAQRCWKWFSPENQGRGSGEPSIIAGITREVMQDYAVDARRVYVAGMSAGGAAAAILAEAYPELYAAAGVHSGLACGSAHDLPSALAAMRRGTGRAGVADGGRPVPTIVFHGDRDTTVSPRNASDVAERSLGQASSQTRIRTGQAGNGCHAYTCTSHLSGTGRVLTEQWMIHGAGHTWSGGSAAGTHTDPLGPDATREMLRFFWDHPKHG